MIKAALDMKHIPYEIVSDEDEINETAAEYGEMSMPFGFVEGKFYRSKDFQKWVMSQEG